MSTTGSTSVDTTIVLGGSLAGLLAAAAVASHSRRVVVVDRDPLAPEPNRRPGTPHTGHVHGLLASGRAAIEALLPGTTEELVAHGAISNGDVGSTGRWWIGGGLVSDCTVGMSGLASSRPLLEAYLLARVRALPNVTVLDHTDVLGLVPGADGASVAAVRLRDLADDTAREETLAADLVVDATGRAGRARRWFGAVGWAAPPEERVIIGLRYASTVVAAAPEDVGGRSVVISAATPATPRGGAAVRQEDGTWKVTLFGYAEDQPPLDNLGLRRFARTVVSPDFAELLDGRQLLEEPHPNRFPHSVRRLIRDVPLPGRFAFIGDAICSFDPAFGQGMTVAALEAAALAACLAAAPDALGQALTAYHQQADEVVDRAWTIVTGADLCLPGTGGVRPRGHALTSAYIRRAQRAARRDPVVATALMRTINLVAPPASLMAPPIALRVLRANLTQHQAPGSTARAQGHPSGAPAPAGVPVGQPLPRSNPSTSGRS